MFKKRRFRFHVANRCKSGLQISPKWCKLGLESHLKIIQISSNFRKLPNLCKSKDIRGLRQPTKLPVALRHHLTMSEFSARLGYVMWILQPSDLHEFGCFLNWVPFLKFWWDFQTRFAWLHSKNQFFLFLNQEKIIW